MNIYFTLALEMKTPLVQAKFKSTVKFPPEKKKNFKSPIYHDQHFSINLPNSLAFEIIRDMKDRKM